MSQDTLAPSRTVTSRDPKGLKFMSIVSAKYDKARLSDEEAQRVNGALGGLADLVGNFISENRHNDKYKDEEVRSNYSYPAEYRGPKPIREQVNILAKMFDLSLGGTEEYIEKVLPSLTLPEGAEGWFAIPSVDAIAARFFPKVKDPADKYCRAVRLVFEKIKTSRKFYNYRDGEIDTNHLRMQASTAHALDLIAEKQRDDVLIVPSQFGKRHAGRSVRRAREVMEHGEFGHGSLAVGSMILVHPERLVRYEELDVDCPGDEFSPGADRDFSKAPAFSSTTAGSSSARAGSTIRTGTMVPLRASSCSSHRTFSPRTLEPFAVSSVDPFVRVFWEAVRTLRIASLCFTILLRLGS